jgi:hypothetical protein
MFSYSSSGFVIVYMEEVAFYEWVVRFIWGSRKTKGRSKVGVSQAKVWYKRQDLLAKMR